MPGRIDLLSSDPEAVKLVRSNQEVLAEAEDIARRIEATVARLRSFELDSGNPAMTSDNDNGGNPS